MVASPPLVMRRPLAPTLAVFAMVTQITLAVTAPLGLVFCVGETHAAVELAADDCCASHGSVVPVSVTTIERACCSDIPLYAAVRPVADGPRSSSGSGASALAMVPAAFLPAGSDGGAAWTADPSPRSARGARRLVVLRV